MFSVKFFIIQLFLHCFLMQNENPTMKNGDMIDLDSENTYFIYNNQKKQNLIQLKESLSEVEMALKDL